MSDLEKVPLPLDRPPLSRRLKFMTTFAVYLGNIAYGCAFTTYGPALVDLRNKYDTDTETISYVFTVLTVSYLFGALTSGFIYNFIRRQLGVVILLGLMAASMYVAPICPTMLVFFASSVFLGFTAGAYDATQIVWIMEIWQNEARPFIQAQHFCYAFGSLLPSLVLAPFLTSEPDDDEIDGITTTTEASDVNPTEKLVVPFIIVGALVTIAAVTQLLLFIFARYHAPPPEEGRLDAALEIDRNQNEIESNNNEKGSISVELVLKPPRDWYKIKLIVLAAMFMGTYQGMEMCTMQFFSPFAQNGKLEMSKSEAAYVLAGLTGAFTAGRAAGILIIIRLPPQLVLCVNLTLITIANFILLFFGHNSVGMIWTGAIVLGIGFSTVYASFCAFIERHLFFSNWIGAIMLICGSLVAAIYPLIIGGLIDENAEVITYTSFFSVTCCVFALAVVSKIVYSRQQMVKRLQGQKE